MMFTRGPKMTFSHEDHAFTFVAGCGRGGGGGGGGCVVVVVEGGGSVVGGGDPPVVGGGDPPDVVGGDEPPPGVPEPGSPGPDGLELPPPDWPEEPPALFPAPVAPLFDEAVPLLGPPRRPRFRSWTVVTPLDPLPEAERAAVVGLACPSPVFVAPDPPEGSGEAPRAALPPSVVVGARADAPS